MASVPYSRTLLALLLPFVALFVAVAVFAGLGSIAAGSTVCVLLILFLGHLTAGWANSQHHPSRPLRITLGLGTLVAAFLFVQLGRPSTDEEWALFIPILTTIVLGVGAFVLASRAPRAAFACLLPAAGWALFGLYRTLPALETVPSTPAFVYSMALTLFVYAAWFAALWHGWRLMKQSTT